MLRIALVIAASLAMHAPAHAQTTPETATATAPPAAPSTTPPAAEEVDRQFARISQGWKPTQRGKTTLYCRNETSLGTRVGRNVCLTRQQLLDRAQAGQEARDRMAKPNQCTGTCTTGS